MPDAVVNDLLSGLSALRRACDDSDWERAYTLMHQHDCDLREAMTVCPVSALAPVLDGQRELLLVLVARRDDMAGDLTLLRGVTGIVNAYRDAGDRRGSLR
ncbi:MAG: hypothetical protein ACOY3X_12130 [Pseudomonadota bacterium]